MKATIKIRNYRRHGRKIINGLAALTLLLVGASGAKAADDKVYPGTMCVQEGSARTVYYNDQGRVLNYNGYAVTVTCPFVRDNTTEKWRSVKVVLADRNQGADISCTAISAQSDGLWGGFGPQTKTTTGAKFNWWEFDTLTFNPQSQERHGGTYFLRCTIPALQSGWDPSGIYSYFISEP